MGTPLKIGSQRMGRSRTSKVTTRTLDNRLKNFQIVKKITFHRTKRDGRREQRTVIGTSHIFPIDNDFITIAVDEAFRNAIPQIDFSFDSFTLVDQAFIQYEKIPLVEAEEIEEIQETLGGG